MLLLAIESPRSARMARSARLSAGAAAITIPVWAPPKASSATVGGVVLSMVWPGTPIILTGYTRSQINAASSTAETPASSHGRRPANDPSCQAIPS